LKRFVYILQLINISLLLSTCSEYKPNTNSTTLSIELCELTETKNALIFVVSDYDCHFCVASINQWIDDVNNKDKHLFKNLFGLYFGNKNEPIHYKILEKTKKEVSWYFHLDPNIYLKIEELSTNKKGPFAVRIENGEIVYVLEVNTSVYK